MEFTPTGVLWTLVISGLVFGSIVAVLNWRKKK